MVQMGMREQDRIDLAGRHGQMPPIAQPQWLVTLKQTTIDQQPLVVVLDQVFKTGDGVGSAQKGDGDSHAVMVGAKGPGIGHSA
jgi:hypothetical protein